ncbi:ABC transporter ATP-binding protein [Alkalihalobacillus sp. LMS6]|uniref:ABC transporter ATP-binding protein n=1 Tax=Alkalihalobacillus sp. LMS6 TaxID=2924034 RepID=UPI0020D1054D|nr:ABC transporter ATP-binding protein [Alkalihalobacillus sp. LMS6]UTR06298.1 ABC transporter ATP-binding protein [Alkalihalobacillus sp. LMS6]
MTSILELTNVSKVYGDKKALNEVDLPIQKGEIFGLLGPSGSGKTTMLKLLTGQIKPSAGTVHAYGAKVNVESSEWMSVIGIMTDNSALYERLTVYDNLNLFASLFSIDEKEEQINNVLQAVQLENEKKTIAKNLSKGMKQRVMLARALLHEPEVLFLDEPTSALDPATTAHVHTALKQLNENGTTIFITTHNMEEAETLCDRVAFLHEGEIATIDTPRNLRLAHSEKKILVHAGGDVHTLSQNEADADILASLMREQSIDTIHSQEPTLGEIFIKLTGGRLT